MTAEITSDHADEASRRAFSLIVNTLGAALKDEQWMPLSERVRISENIYDALVNGGAEIRVAA